MIEISDTDIEYAEKIFLPEGCSFDSERRTVIKCMESKDLQACPGSGKTTTLLAKLAILAQRMPFEDNKGICVLTHTNVAINEIKRKLGKKGDILFSYPNYFGTIQSFVDRYLAIPACIYYYDIRPSRIDSDSYDFEFIKQYKKLPYKGLRGWIYYNKIKKNPTSEFDYVKGIRFDFINERFFDNKRKELKISKKSTSYKQLLEIKEDLLKDGFLHYDDAYSLAFRYLYDFGEILKKTFTERFSFIFIDEMQDTNKYQNEIMDQIFEKSRVTIQRFGDINQSIHDGIFEEDYSLEVRDECLCINESKRFSGSIAKVTKELCLKKQNLIGNSSVPDIPPKLLVFDDEAISSVLPYFIQVIKEYEICNENSIFKAVGWVGKKNQNKRTLSTYYPCFQNRSHLRKIELDFLNEYIQKVDDNKIKIEGAKYYRQLMINALLKILRLSEIKDLDNSRHFTESTLFQYLEKKDLDKVYTNFVDNFNSKVADWCLMIHSGEDISDNFKNFILKEFCPCFEDIDIEKLNNFFESHDIDQKKQTQASNVYNKEDISIEVATVHSVKGETHTATLYLETFNYEYDIETIIDYLRKSSGKPSKRQTKALKMAYVGMTRPTFLLCVAAHKDSVSGNEEYLRGMGWEIREVKNEN
ncbi:MAG: UvrD-helicase domain-containing protein [Methanosarcina vacuolata]|jgi:superfamily I DNA/RNA helicase|nr:UvrD-helicase domain-containing protein [Methanosarcina vacuolata]